jgi:pimeloyl-ACP methyl ester carboxylesterase
MVDNMKIVTGERCDGGLRPKEARIDAGGIRWNYLEWGNRGHPLVLWHGITGNARNWWRVGPFLAGLGFHVWAPDMPGHGRSDDAPNGYAVEQTARLLDAWLASLQLDAPIVVGHSWGGFNALAHALLPEAQVRPRALVLEDPALRLADDPSERVSFYTQGLGMPCDDASIAEIAEANPRWHPCDVRWKAEARQYARRSAIEGFFWHNAGVDKLNELGQLSIPTLLLLGDHAQGGLFTPDQVELVQQVKAASVTLEVIPGSSHSLHRDSFVPFSMALGTWLRRWVKRGP